MKIIEYTDKLRNKWEDFVESANNGTIFHLQNFLEYHRAGRFEHRHLIFADREIWEGVLPGATALREGKRVHSSHPGASFGGIATAQSCGVKDAHRIVELWIDWAKNNGFEGVEFTRVPIIYHLYPDEHVDFALIRKGARIVKRELTAVLKLSSDFEKSFALFRPEARTATRKAQKAGMKIDPDGDIPAFYEILKENLSARHNVQPTHTLEELLDLKKRFPRRIHQFNAMLCGEPVAGVSLWEVNPRALIAFYISHREHAQEFRPLNLVFSEIFRWAIEREFQWLDFGTYTLNMEPNFGLARFKEGFGAKGIFRDTIRLIF